jgi:hypothetical protein
MFLDPDIDKVEARIVRRRHELAQHRRELKSAAQQTRRRTMHALSSPGALIGAAAVGFLAGGGFSRRHNGHDTSSARRSARTGVAGALMTGAMWLVRARFGSAAGLAHYLMQKGQLLQKGPRLRRPEATSGRHWNPR